MNDRSGEVLDGRYSLVRLIGEGGMGQVYEGQHLITGRKVAVKFLLDELANNAEAVGRFYREARAATAIGSEHICQVLDMRPPEHGQPFLVLEYLHGDTLAERLAQETHLSIQEALEVMVQTCDALGAAHRAGIVHRDIKPENIFLVERPGKPPLVKLLDFGISKFSDTSKENFSLTKTGTVLGTPYYMSPEQARGDRAIGPLSDLYSVGVILYEMLAGQVPFDAEAFSALVVKIVSAVPDHPSDLRPDIPRDLGDLALKAFAREEEERFQSADELGQALRDYAAWQEISLAVDDYTPVSHVGNPFAGGLGASGRMTPGGGLQQPASGLQQPASGLQQPASGLQQPGVSRLTGTPMTWEQEGEGSNRRLLWIVGGLGTLVVLLLVGAGAVFLWVLPALGPTTQEPVVVYRPMEPSPQADAGAAAPPVIPVITLDGGDGDASGAASGDAGAAIVRFRIAVEPASARIFVDGEAAEGNPAEIQLPADGARHTIRAAARGYVEATRELVADQDGELEIALDRRRRHDRPTKAQPQPRPRPTKTKTGSGGGSAIIADPWAR